MNEDGSDLEYAELLRRAADDERKLAERDANAQSDSSTTLSIASSTKSGSAGGPSMPAASSIRSA